MLSSSQILPPEFQSFLTHESCFSRVSICFLTSESVCSFALSRSLIKAVLLGC